MATNVSLARFSELAKRYEGLKKSHRNKIEKAKHGFKAAADALVVASSAGAVGYVQGRFGAKKIGPVPWELVAAAGFHAVGVLEPGGEAANRQLHNAGNGILAAYAATVARGHGRKAAIKAGAPAMAGVASHDQLSGDDVFAGGGMQSEEDLLKLALRM